MFEPLLLLAPGLIAAAVHSRERKLPLRSLEFAVAFIGYACAIDVFVVGVSYLRGHGAAAPGELFANVGALARFGALALVSAFAFPYLLLLAEELLGRIRRNG